MKSSDPVFTRHNPFPPEPQFTRAHYNPSRAKKIPKQQKRLALSPVRFDQLASSPDSSPHAAALSPEDQRFLKGSRRVVFCPPPSVKDQQIFSESWPSTDQSSSPASVTISSSSEPQALTADHTEPSGTQESSVLAKYIERFRYGRPQSREERQRVTTGLDGHPLWSMSSSSPQPSSSTPTQISKEHFRGSHELRSDRNDSTGSMRSPAEQSRANRSLSPPRGLLDLSALDLSDSSHCEPAEPEILQLQEGASRLLQKSENSLSSGSSGLPISSEGLGCTDFSSPVSVDEPVRRPIVPGLMDTANLLSASSVSRGGLIPAPSMLGTRGSRTRPEDDILFQWRLRRKMEQARQWSEISSHTSSFHQPPLSRLAQQPSPVSADPSQTAVYSPAPAAERPAAVSISACSAYQPALPVSSTTICTELHPETSKQTPEDPTTFSSSVPLPQPAKQRTTVHHQGPSNFPQCHPRASGSPSGSSVEPCKKHHTQSLPSPQPSEWTDGEEYGYQHREDKQTKGKLVVERSRTKVAKESRKKQLDRHVGYGNDDNKGNQINSKASNRHGRGQERVSRKAKGTRRENRRHSEGLSSGDHAPPPSPIHNTLGQVVSEVLFLGTDSPTQSRTPCSSDSSRLTPLPPPQSPAPPPQSVPQPSEVIGQLMQEAQDSDGLEFEDDPLLLVLRQQRKWVKEQLREVDATLDELNED
ncbi:proline and serine-rich protein 3 [Astyanax mexicanus]|uniref:proline and serine-rich protein 3 n=1 Tax=Astyanax mexicanus TaxID=7994 RepID=UPI0020CB35F2|nr:proline and serine-rich protein 3 [Astyanax mexicanus]